MFDIFPGSWMSNRVTIILPQLTIMKYVHVLLFVHVFLGTASSGLHAERNRTPNIILILADDFGYGDLSSYGHPNQEFGRIDELAQEGMKFTHWYSADVYCTPSRGALLTGRLPMRSGVIGGERVFFPNHFSGLSKSEITIAEALKTANYTTGIVGKWHLGINEFTSNDGNFLPHNHGFDYVGTILPFSLVWNSDDTKLHLPYPNPLMSFLYYNRTIVEQPIVTKHLTSKLVHDAKTFLHNHSQQENPFFLYFSLPQTHSSMFASERFNGSSKRGPYGDMVNEMHWAVGEVIDTLKLLEIDTDTLVLFLSDHGPHLEVCTEGGSAGKLRGGKGNFFEGGLRVPAIAWWKDKISPGTVSSRIISTMDIFPTLLDVAGITENFRQIFDGHSILNELIHRNGKSHDTLFFYCDDNIVAMRYKNYKIHFKTHKTVDDSPSFRKLNCPQGIPKENLYLDTAPFHSHSFSCKNMDDHSNKPLVYDIELDPFEQYPLPSLPDNVELFETLYPIIMDHIATLSPTTMLAHPNFRNSFVQPCCNPPYCHCHRHHKAPMCALKNV